MTTDRPPFLRPVGVALLITAALSLAPFLSSLPLPMAALACLLLAWQGVLVRQEAPPPPRSLLLLLTLLAAALCFFEFRGLFGREPGLALLGLFLPLKLLEGRTRRDVRATLLLCCFLMTGQFLNAQSPGVGLMVLACATAIIATSAMLERPALPARPAIRLASRLLLSAVPLLVVLFVLFPRIDGPLWRLPGDANRSASGLSDSMEPGSISNLILSGEIAFRASFDGDVPRPRDRYWRGPVLTDYDGRVWRARPARALEQPAYRTGGRAFHYTLTLEAQDRPWLLALDFPGAGISGVRYGSDFTLLSPEPVRTRKRLDLIAFPDASVGTDESPARLRAALTLPENSNPRSFAAGQDLLRRFPAPAARLEAILDFMRRAGLAYTLTPPLLGRNPADEFLFDTKQGFCEHFSGSFVVLARAAGLPARVVTGYQGGEINPVDGTLVVRQSDAHAWAEVWLENRGWVRVDPTAASAPSRIDAGIASALGDGDLLPMSLRQGSVFLRELRHRWEAASNGWNQWVLGYNASRQNELLQRLGLKDRDWLTLTLLLGAGAGLCVGVLLLRLWPRARRLDALDTIWRNFTRKLSRRGIARLPHESTYAFARRAALALPQCADTIETICEHYATLRYGRSTPSTAELRLLRQSVQGFKP